MYSLWSNIAYMSASIRSHTNTGNLPALGHGLPRRPLPPRTFFGRFQLLAVIALQSDAIEAGVISQPALLPV